MVKIYHGMNKRTDVLKFIHHYDEHDGAGIELGVAEGSFSEQILREFENTYFHLYSVDMWAGDRGHDVDEYRRTVMRLDPWKRSNTILKMTFDEALPMFADNYFNFIYVDGYAHTGEEGGKYFHDWWSKLAQGGIMAGDDYHSDWPLVVSAVDEFAASIGRELNIIPNLERVDKWSQYPTWFVRK